MLISLTEMEGRSTKIALCSFTVKSVAMGLRVKTTGSINVMLRLKERSMVRLSG